MTILAAVISILIWETYDSLSRMQRVMKATRHLGTVSSQHLQVEAIGTRPPKHVELCVVRQS